MVETASAALRQRAKHPAPYRQREAMLGLVEKLGAKQMRHRRAKHMLVAAPVGKANASRQAESEVDKPSIKQRHTNFQRMRHAVGIAIPQQHVAHVEAAFEQADAPYRIPWIDRHRLHF